MMRTSYCQAEINRQVAQRLQRTSRKAPNVASSTGTGATWGNTGPHTVCSNLLPVAQMPGLVITWLAPPS